MPDRRRHRGAHPRDAEWFAPSALPALRSAAHDLGWLWSRGYAETASLALVGDRYALSARQRAALLRVVCSDAAEQRRASRRAGAEELRSAALAVDGFNVCIGVEVALSGGVVLVGRDGAYRDLASVHGTYRRVTETPRALELLVDVLAARRPASVTWYFDRPVSNSGTLAGLLRALLSRRQLDWQIELAADVDRRVSAPGVVAVSADSGVLDAAERWYDLAGSVIREHAPSAWVVDLWRA